MKSACDSKGKFLDASIGNLGSTTDYLDFGTSSLHSKLEKPGFLAPSLVSYGDNTYVSNVFMVTPIQIVSSGSKDACNFY